MDPAPPSTSCADPGSPRAFTPGEGRGLTRGEPATCVRFDLRWSSSRASHCDSLVATRLDLSRALLPESFRSELIDKPRGHVVCHEFGPGELVAPWSDAEQRLLDDVRFLRVFTGRGHLQPRLGRWYPRTVLRDLDHGTPSGRQPWRIVGLDGAYLEADFNHPLAEHPLRLTATIEALGPGDARQTEGSDTIAALVTNGGPGMQARFRDQPTDFWSDQPFRRQDTAPDAAFYARPRLVDHIDSAAIAAISALYGRLIRPGARVLDLMSSWHSHLPDALASGIITGLGMNAEELEHNPMLDARIVQDLNSDPRLPFADRSFEAIVCTVSVEYLTDPFMVFREAARVLAPGGLFVVTFSNRWFPTKAIGLWEAMHDFERPGLVLEYFLESGLFVDLETWSLRGLPRPADDPYAHRLTLSDPVFAVWGSRA